VQTPADYAARYESITVLSPDGGDDLATGLSVDRYLLGIRNGGYDERLRVAKKIQKDLAIRRKTDPSAKIVVRVSTPDGVDEQSFDNLTIKDDDQLWGLLRYPYAGKGSPDGIQALLQLGSVELPGSPAAISPANFQAYCDKWLGLDCNGLVGNFLRHIYHDIDWWDVTATKSKVSPNNLITDIWDGFDGEVRATADEVDFNNLNLLVMVNAAGKIIPGGGGGPGHIMISQPREIEFDVGLKKLLGVPDDQEVPGIQVLESTAAKDSADNKNGLAKSIYAYADYKPQKGVMRVRRGLNGAPLNVRIKGAQWTG
jgi:hypothetical protein